MQWPITTIPDTDLQTALGICRGDTGSGQECLPRRRRLPLLLDAIRADPTPIERARRISAAPKAVWPRSGGATERHPAVQPWLGGRNPWNIQKMQELANTVGS